MVLQTIKNKLQEIDTNVFYGAVDNRMKETLWNYIVFNRNNLKVNQNKTGYTDSYVVHIVREEWIPEGVDMEVIEKMLEIDGMRVSGDGIYSYSYKPSTNTVIEMLSIEFLKPRKK